MLGQLGTWWPRHCPSAPGFQPTPPAAGKRQQTQTPPADSSCSLMAAPGEGCGGTALMAAFLYFKVKS